MNTEPRMMCGTVSGFDTEDGVGLIDSDDGDILLFSAAALDTREAARMTIGLRVQFLANPLNQLPHADSIRISE